MKSLDTYDFPIKLEQHKTTDVLNKPVNGSLTVIWRDYDNLIKNHPKMVYVSSVNSGEIKGPHIHTKRNSYFTCIHGKVIFILKNNDGTYTETELNSEKPVMVFVPKNVPSAHINVHDGISTILTLADIAWRPNDNEMKNMKFEDYDWNKWKK